MTKMMESLSGFLKRYFHRKRFSVGFSVGRYLKLRVMGTDVVLVNAHSLTKSFIGRSNHQHRYYLRNKTFLKLLKFPRHFLRSFSRVFVNIAYFLRSRKKLSFLAGRTISYRVSQLSKPVVSKYADLLYPTDSPSSKGDNQTE